MFPWGGCGCNDPQEEKSTGSCCKKELRTPSLASAGRVCTTYFFFVNLHCLPDHWSLTSMSCFHVQLLIALGQLEVNGGDSLRTCSASGVK